MRKNNVISINHFSVAIVGLRYETNNFTTNMKETLMSLFAYIDPFTGSLVLQLLAMAFFSSVVFFKRAKNYVFSLFGAKPKHMETLDEEEPDVIKMETVSEEQKKEVV
jgi:hypothetical protein